MANKLTGKATKIYVNGQDVSSNFNLVDTQATTDVVDVSTFGAEFKENCVGPRSGTMRLQGYYDQTGAWDDLMDQLYGLSSPLPVVTVLPAGDVQGLRGKAAAELSTTVSTSSPVGGAVAVTADFQSNTGMDAVRNLYARGTLTPAAPGGTILPDGAAGTKTLIGYLQVFSIPAGNALVVIEHSANGTTGWTTALSFTAVAAAGAPQAQRATATGVMQPYKRVNVSGGTAICEVSYTQE